MRLVFTAQEMISSLEKIGYVIKEETETYERRTYHDNFEDVPISVYNCYYNGEKFAVYAGYGISRVEFVFKSELCKRLLTLF